MISDSRLPETLAIKAETEPINRTARESRSYLLNLFQIRDKNTKKTDKGKDTAVRWITSGWRGIPSNRMRPWMSEMSAPFEYNF